MSDLENSLITMNGLASLIPSNVYSPLWWSVSPYEIDMELHIYARDNGSYDSLFNWEPENNQWWITGFDYHEDSWDINVNDVYMIASINFNDVESNGVNIDDNADIYDAFLNGLRETPISSSVCIINDELTRTVYVIWGSRIPEYMHPSDTN